MCGKNAEIYKKKERNLPAKGLKGFYMNIV